MSASKVFGDIKKIAWLDIDHRLCLIVTDNYDGEPWIGCEYDVLICSRNIFKQYKDALIPRHLKKLNIQVKLLD